MQLRATRDRVTTALLSSAAVLILAGGFIHLREWIETYRDIPAAVPGAAVVRFGFPVNAATSLVVAGALVVTMLRFTRFVPAVVIAIAFQAVSLATLILSRTGSVLGWREPIWTDGANQTRAVEIAALVALLAALGLLLASLQSASGLWGRHNRTRASASV